MRDQLLYWDSGDLYLSSAVLSHCGGGIIRTGSQFCQLLSKRKTGVALMKMTRAQGKLEVSPSLHRLRVVVQ